MVSGLFTNRALDPKMSLKIGKGNDKGEGEHT